MIKKIQKLISYYGPYKKVLFLDILFSIIVAGTTTAIPLMLKYVINETVNFPLDKAVYTLSITASIILISFFVMYLCKRFMKFQGKLFSTKIEADIKLDIFKHLQKMPFAFYDQNKIGKLLSIVNNDTFGLSVALKEVPQMIIDFVIKSVCIFTALFIINKTFGFFMVGIFLIVIAYIFYYVPKIQKEVAASHETFSNLTSNLEENLSGIRTVQSFTNENLEVKKFKNGINAYVQDKKRIFKISSVFDSSVYVFIMGLIPFSTILGMFFVINQNINMGDLMAIMLFMDILFGPIFSVLGIAETIQESSAGLTRVFDLLEVKPEIFDSPQCITLPKVKGSIEFKNVSFKHKTGKEIFKNLNLKINPGEYIALVGPSGSGKSTFCNLIPRFYDVSSGQVLVDQTDVRNINLENLRKNIGFVHQETFLFSGTIKENIEYGKLGASMEEIVEAAKNAYCHDFIMKLPNKYETLIGQHGSSLSGGQKQRIAIARTFLKNPPILIFDEATSSLDNESEKYIQKSMEKLSVGRTTIVIAHRLSTIQNAKRILVLSNGNIVQEGTHKELINQEGVYLELYKLL